MDIGVAIIIARHTSEPKSRAYSPGKLVRASQGSTSPDHSAKLCGRLLER